MFLSHWLTKFPSRKICLYRFMSQQSVPCLGEVETAITRIYCLMLDIFLVSVVLCISLFKNSYLSPKTQYIKNIFPYLGVSMILFPVLPTLYFLVTCDKKGTRTNLQFNKKVVWNFLLKYEASFAGTRNFFHWNEIKKQVVVARTQKGEEKAPLFCQNLHRLHFFFSWKWTHKRTAR